MTESTNFGASAGGGSPLEPLLSSRLLVLANLLRRGAELRYERMLGLSKVEFGIVGMLGRRAPIPVRELATLLGMDKAQLSRALGRLVERKLVIRTTNPDDRRDALIRLTRAGLAAHDRLVAKARAVNDRLAQALAPGEAERLAESVEALIREAEGILEEERSDVLPGA